MKKITISFVSILVLLAIVGGYFYPKFSGFSATNNAVGTTYGSAKIAQINMTPATSAASSTSILNTDSADRIIESSYVDCNTVGTSRTYLVGAALDAFKVRIATTSAGTQVGNVNYAGNMTVSTSSPYAYTASSTDGVLGSVTRIWPAGTYLQFTFNATNTAVCTVGVHYIGF